MSVNFFAQVHLRFLRIKLFVIGSFDILTNIFLQERLISMCNILGITFWVENNFEHFEICIVVLQNISKKNKKKRNSAWIEERIFTLIDLIKVRKNTTGNGKVVHNVANSSIRVIVVLIFSNINRQRQLKTKLKSLRLGAFSHHHPSVSLSF